MIRLHHQSTMSENRGSSDMFAKSVIVVFDPPLPDLSLSEAVGKVTPFLRQRRRRRITPRRTLRAGPPETQMPQELIRVAMHLNDLDQLDS